MKTDELVKRLCEYTEWARANEWEVPITLADDLEAAADTIEHLDNEAADKIEVQAGLLKYGSKLNDAPFLAGHSTQAISDSEDGVPCDHLIEVSPVRHGRWELTVHSFYRDTFNESCELCVYIVANCSECSGNHPNSYQVFSKTIYAPEDAGDDFRFDKKEEENKALQEFQSRNYQFAYYCPNCGAKMDGGAD